MQPTGFQPSGFQPGPESAPLAFIDGAGTSAGTSTASAVGELVTVVVADDYESHWHYAREQKKRRAKAKSLLVPKAVPVRQDVRTVLRYTATVTVLAPVSVVARSGAKSSLSNVVSARALPIVRFNVTDRNVESLQSDARLRVVNVLQELRDLEDMLDLYELLMAA